MMSSMDSDGSPVMGSTTISRLRTGSHVFVLWILEIWSRTDLRRVKSLLQR